MAVSQDVHNFLPKRQSQWTVIPSEADRAAVCAANASILHELDSEFVRLFRAA